MFALVPYAECTGTPADDPETVLADLLADLRHLGDRLGADWHELIRRAVGYHGEETDRPADAPALSGDPAAPCVEVVAVRDPDGPTTLEVFCDGEPVAATEYIVDAGRAGSGRTGPTRAIRTWPAPPRPRAALIRAYSDPPGGQYVEGGEETSWFDGVTEAVAGCGV